MNIIKADFDGVKTPTLKNAKVGKLCSQNCNKTGLQPVSRPVERILGFFPKGFNAKNGAKMF